jgi:hypothetical protein
VAGADRIVITWPSGAIKNTWLEVQVLATAQTGLATSDVFYWGNRVADSLTSPGPGKFETSSTDAAQVYATIGNSSALTNPRDYNRDGQVSSTDAVLVFANIGSIVRLNIPAPEAPSAQAMTTAFAGPSIASSRDGGARSAIASGLAQPAVSRSGEQAPLLGMAARLDEARKEPRIDAMPAITEIEHWEAMNAASDSLEEILLDLGEDLDAPKLAALL